MQTTSKDKINNLEFSKAIVTLILAIFASTCCVWVTYMEVSWPVIPGWPALTRSYSLIKFKSVHTRRCSGMK